MLKYLYKGDEPLILTEHHKQVEKYGDVIEVETPIDSFFFVLVEEEKKAAKSNKSEEVVQ